MGGTDFNQFIGLRNQLVKAADKFVREESLSPVLIPTISKDKDEQVNLAHKVVDVVDRANRKIWVALLRYNVDNPERSYAQVRLFARKTEDEKFQQVVYVNYKFQEFIYLVDLMNSLYDKVISNQIICNVLKKLNSSVYHLSFLFNQVKKSSNIGDNRNLFLKLESKLRLYHVVPKTPKTSPEKPKLTVVEMQHLLDNEMTNPKQEKSRLKWTIYNDRRKVCLNFQTDTEKLNIAVYR